MVERVKAAERDRDRLEGAKAEAEAYLTMEKELARLNVLQAKLNLTEIAANQTAAAKSVEDLEGRLVHERAKNAEMKKAIVALERE